MAALYASHATYLFYLFYMWVKTLLASLECKTNYRDVYVFGTPVVSMKVLSSLEE
jgi:hypothetical protein